jgi:hypothetical protein
MIQKIINWFQQPTTNKFKVFGWLAIAVVYAVAFWMLLSMSGCSSFEKTTKYKPNTYWIIDRI